MKLVSIGYGNVVVASRVVDLKTEIEKVREQVLNVE